MTIVAKMLKDIARFSERHAMLPERVLQKIDSHQAKSEQLIGWVQLAVVVIFSVLYALSPKTFPEDVAFTPVPWVLSAYFVFTVVHILYSHRQLPPDWFTYTSIVVDMALIYLLMWSFHLQYMQPPSFYLKAPTLLYVFIFIGMRALRFEVKFILFAGFAAAAGWMLMILYVIYSNPADSMVTRDYVHYLTSNSVLLGAEFDKVISISIVGVVLAAAVYRAKKLLFDSIIDANVAEDLAHFVPEQVVEDIKLSDAQPLAGNAQNYSAAVMFTDIVSFTTISEKLPPKQVVNTLNQYFTALEKVLDSYGGTINQFQGDAILASFNEAQNGLSPSECAVKAAIDIQNMLLENSFGDDDYSIPLRNRIGINTGEVVGGFMGSQHRLIYTVHGDVVNLAARLEQLNKQFGTEILVSEATRDACSEDFAFKHVGSSKVKGRSEETQVFTLEY
ncbi:MAG: adenylate/guanylate cyclase domain-containing protein [Motiliproteus sp.]|nr:adenylate/guanylate cyclase domain-containing protein [Motiliproteus sp.]MCW9051955.1 adenylate/guanylate cyclase domain-containing protein [Motiliproteus sp.]